MQAAWRRFSYARWLNADILFFTRKEQIMQTSTKLLTRKDVEREFGISKRFLEIAAVRGDGPPFVKLSRLVYYIRDDVIHWILERRVKSTSDLPKSSPLRRPRA